MTERLYKWAENNKLSLLGIIIKGILGGTRELISWLG